MQGIVSCFMNTGQLWDLAMALIALVTGLVGCVVGGITKARQCRKLRLENERLQWESRKVQLEIALLKTEVAKRGIAISIPGAQELDAALRDRAAFASLKTLGKVSELTRASVPEDPAYEQYVLDIREKLRRLMIRVAVGAGAVCSSIAVVLWW